MFLKIGVLKGFANFTGKQLCWSFFLKKLQALRPATLLKTDSKTGARAPFYRTTPVAASENNEQQQLP